MPEELDLPVASWLDVGDETTAYIIDSGASSDVRGYPATLDNFLRKMLRPASYDTASVAVHVNEGIRIQMAPWDVVADAVLMEGSPNLISTGRRCLDGGFTHI